MGSSLKKLCNSIRIRSTCVSNCCSDNSSIDAIKKENEPHAHHHHEIIITDKMVKIVCDDNQSDEVVDISSIGSALSSEVKSSI
jgi:hypothetical protein